MWTSVTPILTLLPRISTNGVLAGPGSDWGKTFLELERYRNYKEGWDGQDATGIPNDLIESAIALASVLRTRAVTPPCCVVPDFDGTVSFEWDTDDGAGAISLNITEVGYAEFTVCRPGRDRVHLILTEAVSV